MFPIETNERNVNKPYGLSANQSRPTANVKRKKNTPRRNMIKTKKIYLLLHSGIAFG